MKVNNLTESMQTVVNQRLWKFIEQHGGVKAVSNKLGVVPQTLYNMRDNRSFPSAGTLALIKQQYPHTNINYFISESETEVAERGPTTEKAELTASVAAPPDVSAVIQAKDDLIRAQQETINRMAAHNEALEEEVKQYANDMREFARKNFPSSDSHTADQFSHDLQTYRTTVAGFIQQSRKDDGAEPIVLPMPIPTPVKPRAPRKGVAALADRQPCTWAAGKIGMHVYRTVQVVE